jgi:hypothetical protein
MYLPRSQAPALCLYSFTMQIEETRPVLNIPKVPKCKVIPPFHRINQNLGLRTRALTYTTFAISSTSFSTLGLLFYYFTFRIVLLNAMLLCTDAIQAKH